MADSQRASYAAYVEIASPDGTVLYTGEAIYRPRRLHPLTGEPAPAIGVPDDSMSNRPSPREDYAVWYNGDRIRATGVYLERVSTCWWFVLAQAPGHAPTV